MAKSKPKSPEPEVVAKPSPEAVLLFLKHAALDASWTATDLANSLGIEPTIAKQIAEELTLVGYAESIRGKRETWRNTEAGNTVSGVKTPRLTRAKAEELVTDLVDRTEAFNVEHDRAPCITKMVAFGGINSQHEKIQDVEIGVQVEPKLGRNISVGDLQDAIKTLGAKSPRLKLHPLQQWPRRMGRVIWER